MPDVHIISNGDIKILSAEVDALRLAIADDRATRRAIAMEKRRALLAYVASVELEWSIQPTTSELRKAWKDGKISIT